MCVDHYYATLWYKTYVLPEKYEKHESYMPERMTKLCSCK